MKPTEAAALLTIAAAYDNRKPDADQAKAWALALDGATFEDCREAIVAHYRKSREWLMPVDVLQGVRALRNERWNAYARRYGPVLIPPSELADDPAAGNRWTAEITSRIRNGEITTPDEIPVEAIEAGARNELGGAA